MTKPSSHRAAFIFIFVVVVLDVAALGLVIPILPALIESFVGGNTAEAAKWVGIFSTVWALMQFVFSPLIGALSDRFGRRPVVLASCFGLAADYALMALASSLAWLMLGRIICGIMAANAVAATAYIADVTEEKDRAAKFGMLGAAWGIGFIIGPALGGYLGSIDLRLPFWVAGGVTLINALYGFFVLPESLPVSKRAAFEWRKANPFSALKFILQVRGLGTLATVNFLYNVAHYVLPAVFALYTSFRYGWDPKILGLTLALVGVLNVVVQAGLVKPIVKKVGERNAMLVGLTCGAIGFIWIGVATTGTWFSIGLGVFAFMGVFGPGLQGLMTRQVPADAQGRLQGFNASVVGIAGLVGPALFASAFSFSIADGPKSQYPGAAFFVAAGLLIVGALLALIVGRKSEASNA